MDPVSAIGLAAAVLQFADFGAQLVSKARNISSSTTNRTDLETELLVTFKDLDRLSQGAKQALKDKLRHSRSEDLSRVLDEVETLHEEFSDLLKILESRKNKNTLKAAFSAYRNEGQVAKAMARISVIRTRILSYVLFSLWYVCLPVVSLSEHLRTNFLKGRPLAKVQRERLNLETS